ncbi:MAG TPA: alanine--glyoxylate aminotransferase family protein [Spirochaetes bacterium]|nr:alanine--glyoxylate aminotransferase family protein [Spirochaetota bacterium]
MKYFLMIPGPVEIADEILDAYQGQPVAHYGPEWTKEYLDIIKRVSKILGSEGMTFLMPGSGSICLDTAAASFCTSKRCLVINNGMFGDRLYNIVSAHTSDVEILKFPLNVPADPDAVKKALSEREYDAVFMTHVETSTSVLNPVKEVVNIVKEHGALFVLDAISSAVIEKLEMDSWGIDITVTACQKGFECPAGLGIITVRSDLLNALQDTPATTWYTDLRVWCDFYDKWHDWHPFPVTLPTNTIMALKKSIEIIETEGLSFRQRMFGEISSRLRKALLSFGLEMYAPEGHHAHGLTAASTGGKFDPSDLLGYLKKTVGIQISGSFGDLKSHVFRIGHMSKKQCSNIILVSLLNGIALFMRSRGLKVPLEEAVGMLIQQPQDGGML